MSSSTTLSPSTALSRLVQITDHLDCPPLQTGLDAISNKSIAARNEISQAYCRARELGLVEELPDWKQLPPAVQGWIQEHPYQTRLLALNIAIWAWPELMSSPALSGLGFTSVGPREGSVASWMHSVIGSPSAGGLFASIQSAGMGGYGQPLVNAAVRVSTAGASLANGAREVSNQGNI